LKRAKKRRKTHEAACCGCNGSCSPCVRLHLRGCTTADDAAGEVVISSDTELGIIFFVSTTRIG
jgi:hypothetical protein